MYHLVVITRSSGLIKYFIPANNLQQYRTKRKKILFISKNSFFINFLGHKDYPWLASCRVQRPSNNSGFRKSTVECPWTGPPWCKDQGMRIPLDTGPLQEGRSNMSFDYLYTNFHVIKFHDFLWLMLIFKKNLSYSQYKYYNPVFWFIFYRFKSLGFSSCIAMIREPTFIFGSSWCCHFCPNKKSHQCSNN